MPSVQTNYENNIAAAVPGLQATMIGATLVSRAVETVAGIGFGKAVQQGTADKGCIAYAGGVLLGITLLDRSAKGILSSATVTDGYPQRDSARVMTVGDVWVTAAVAVVAGDPVYVRPSNGDFQKTNANSAVLVPNARWETSAGIAGLAVVRLNLPG